MSNRSERRQVLFIFKVSCRFWDKVGEGGRRRSEREREREKERTMYFYMAFSERKRGMDRSIGMCVWKVGGRKEKEREKARGCVECNAETRERKSKRKREKRWPTSSRGIQIHVDAAQSGVHHFSTYSHPPLPPTIRCYTLRPFSRSSSSTLVHPLLSI